jgi:uncharacterized protein YaaW (UPF0174 family)
MPVILLTKEQTMAYRRDDDLEFLKNCTSEDLSVLVDILSKDKDGNVRLTEELTMSHRYKRYHPNHHEYWDLIAAEIQCFGANTIAIMHRGGEGVLYREVLTDACDKIKVNYNSGASVEVIEMNLLMKILTDSMENMRPEDLQGIVKDLDLKTTDFSKQAVIASLQAGIRFGGFASYQVVLIVANAVAKAVVGRGLSLAANAGLTRMMGFFAGPIGWVLTALWTAFDIAGPAFRVTIPCVVQVAFLRAKLTYQKT